MHFLTRLFERLVPAGTPRTVASQAPIYSPDEVARAVADRGCLVQVRGDPFAAGAAFVDAVIDAMQGRNWGPAIRFTTRASEAADSRYRIVMLFNGARTATADDLCRHADSYGSVEPPGPSGRIRVIAAWCRDDVVLSEVEGWVTGARGPTDSPFVRLVGQTTRELFPAAFEDPLHRT